MCGALVCSKLAHLEIHVTFQIHLNLRFLHNLCLQAHVHTTIHIHKFCSRFLTVVAGVVLWELIEAKTPYFSMNNKEVVSDIQVLTSTHLQRLRMLHILLIYFKLLLQIEQVTLQNYKLSKPISIPHFRGNISINRCTQTPTHNTNSHTYNTHTHIHAHTPTPHPKFCLEFPGLDDLYALMLSCWQQAPQNRPTFPQIYESLVQIENSHYGVETRLSSTQSISDVAGTTDMTQLHSSPTTTGHVTTYQNDEKQGNSVYLL